MNQTADIPADKLMRLRSNRVLYGAPAPYTGVGRPRVHGNKFKLNDLTTWWTPDQILEVNHSKLGSQPRAVSPARMRRFPAPRRLAIARWGVPPVERTGVRRTPASVV